METSFRQEDEETYWKQLPTEFGGAKLVIKLQELIGQVPSWELVSEFEAHLLREAGVTLATRAQAPLRFLAEQTGWFTADETNNALFEWQEIVFLYGISSLYKKSGSGWVSELHFTMGGTNQPWLDTYGDWVVTFHEETIIGLRRDQN